MPRRTDPFFIRLLAATGLFFCGSSLAVAGGFYAPYQSGPAIAAALAGASARADDASFLLFNPAIGADFSNNSIYLGAQVFSPSIKFKTKSATSPLGAPLTADGSSGEIAETAFAPSFAAAVPLTDGLVLGFTGGSPFAAKIEADPNWAGRFQVLRTDMETINLGISLSYRLTPWISVGAGLNVQRFDGKFEKTELFDNPFVAAPLIEARGFLKGEDWGIGGSAGILLTPVPGTRLGVSYRSRIKHDFKGEAGLYLPLIPADTARYELTTPDVVSIGLEQQITPELRLFSEVQWVNWSLFDGFDIALGSGDRDVRPLDWEDTWMAGIGLGYTIHPGMEITVGLHYDTSVTEGGNTFSPDSDRVMFGFGLTKSFDNAGKLSLHYAHMRFDGAPIDVQDIRTGTLSADFDGKLDILGATYRLDW